MKRKPVITIAVLILALAVSVTAVFGWFSAGKTSIGNIEFETGKVDAKVSLFSLRDFNRDGIPDYDPDAEDHVFKTDLLNPPAGTGAGISIFDALPGEIFTYRLIVENVSNNAIAFALSVSADRTSGAAAFLNDAFTFRTTRTESGAEREYKISLAGSSVALIDAVASGTEGTRVPLIEIPKGGTLTFDFRLAFERLPDLRTSLPGIFGAKTDLNDYLGKSFDGVTFRFEFRQSADSTISA